jgi:SAM-dependent methyltransferase
MAYGMLKARPYYAQNGASAVFYDLLTSADRSLDGDLDLYAGLIPEGGSVLELGAGTGRVSQGLAERGFNVVGLEIAPAMLIQAEAKRVAAPDEVARRLRYVQGDMTAFTLGETFDVVLCPFFAMAHLPGGTAWINAFRSISKHLKPGGFAAIHLPLGDKMSTAAPPADQAVFSRPIEGGRTLTLYVVGRTMNPKIGRMDLTLDYVVRAANGVEQSRDRERLTFYHANPDPIAAAEGLNVAQDPVEFGGVGAIHVYRRP